MWATPAKPCDCCRSAAAMLFCRDDNSFMCITCDTKLHSACHKHAKVWLCAVCEHAPAAVTCKADAASLCVTCDRDIHAANPLARRHERVPVVPFYDTAETVLMLNHEFVGQGQGQDQDPKVDDPWMIPDPGFGGSKYPTDNPELKSMDFFFADSDQFLEFENYGVSSQPFSDSVVPVQTSTRTPLFSSPESRFEIDFTKSNISSFNNNSSSTFTTPSSDVGVVPDGSGSASALSDISYPVMKNTVPVPVPIPNMDMSNGYQIGMDREARVLRYREKRKNRKFEKTVRYASRKAYAETRPRVKGRFAKRVDAKTESDNSIFGAGSGGLVQNDRYGVVPSF